MNLSRTLRLALVSSSLSLSALAALSNEDFTSLRARAEAGDPIAQHNLGLAYADAKDPHFNLVEAYAWLKTASQSGTGSNALGVVKGQLSATQVLEADARASELARFVNADAGPGPIGPDGAPPPALEPASATAEFKKYSDELAAVWKENEQLKAELGKLRASAANFEGERNALMAKANAAPIAPAVSDELVSARKQLAELSAELTKARDEAKAREATLSQAAEKARLTAAEREKTLQGELAAAKAAAVAASNTQTHSADAAVKAAQQQADEAQVKLESALRSLELQQKETAKVQKALLAVEAERSSLADKLAVAEKAAAVVPSAPTGDANVDALQAQLAQAQARIQVLESAAPSASTASSGAPSDELAATQDKLAITLRSFQLQREEIDQLKQKIAELEAAKSSTESKLAETSGQVASAESKAAASDQLQRELALVREQLRHTQNQLAAEINERMRTRDRAASTPPAAGGPLLFSPQRPSPVVAVPTPTPTPESPAREYVVRPGDTLSRIARRTLGDAERWPEILEANRDVISNPSAIPVGVRLRIP